MRRYFCKVGNTPDWKIGKVTFTEQCKPDVDERLHLLSHYYMGDKKGYGNNDLEFLRLKDGGMFIADDQCGVYLYPEQIKHLKAFLAKRS